MDKTTQVKLFRQTKQHKLNYLDRQNNRSQTIQIDKTTQVKLFRQTKQQKLNYLDRQNNTS